MRLKHLLSVFLTLLTLSVGQMWGTDEVFYTLTPAATGGNSSPHNAYGSAATFSCTDNELTIGWSVTGNSYMVPWRLGGKGGDKSSSTSNYTRTVYTTTAIAENVTKIDITHGTSNLNALTTMTVTVSTAQNGGGTVRHTFTLNSSSTPKFEASKTITLERPNAEDWSNCYYLISYTVQAKGKSNQYLEFSRVDFYKTPSVAHTVTLKDNNATLTEASAGAGVTLPSRAGCPTQDFTFAGWTASWEEEQDDWTTTAPTIIPAGTYHPAADVNLYPVYTKTISGESTTTTFNFSYTDWGKSSSFSGTDYNEVSQEDDGITVTYTRNSGSLYANTTSLRFYKSNELTFDAGENSISAISFTGTVGQEDITTDVETCTNTSSSLSWEGTANSVTFTRPNNASSYATLSSATVTHTGGSTTSYISVPNCCTELGSINGSFFWPTLFSYLTC